MAQFVIVVGDKTSHGGIVISGTPTTDIDGKPVARVGDKVTCPCRGHGGITVIVSGDPTCIVNGRAVARHGDKTACGATLLSSQMLTSVQTGGSGTSGLGTALSSTMSARPNATGSIAKAAAFPFDEQVKLALAGDQVVLIGLPWFIKTADGRVFKGRLDGSGQLPRIDTPAEDKYEVLWGDEALNVSEGSV